MGGLLTSENCRTFIFMVQCCWLDTYSSTYCTYCRPSYWSSGSIFIYLQNLLYFPPKSTFGVGLRASHMTTLWIKMVQHFYRTICSSVCSVHWAKSDTLAKLRNKSRQLMPQKGPLSSCCQFVEARLTQWAPKHCLKIYCALITRTCLYIGGKKR